MSSAIKLVVGLGNPGREYAETRHNAGFWWVDALADATRKSFAKEARFHGDVAKPNADVWLLKPNTFMNLSGRAAGALAKFYRITPAEILVVHDELDLQPGDAKLKLGGGHGGHNGLRDIEAQLGSRDYWRLRLGIGHPREKANEQEVADYVLHRPGTDDLLAIEDAMKRSLEVWPLIAGGDAEAAMLKLHTKSVKRSALGVERKTPE